MIYYSKFKMSVFRVITRIIPLNSSEPTFEPASFDQLTDGNVREIKVLNLTEPHTGMMYRIERIEYMQKAGPGETVESINEAYAQKLQNIPGFVELKDGDTPLNPYDKSFQLTLPKVLLGKGPDDSNNSQRNKHSKSFKISVVKNCNFKKASPKKNAVSSATLNKSGKEGKKIATSNKSLKEGKRVATSDTSLTEGEKVITSGKSSKEGEKVATSGKSLKEQKKVATSGKSLKEGGKVATPNKSLKERKKVATSDKSGKERKKVATSVKSGTGEKNVATSAKSGKGEKEVAALAETGKGEKRVATSVKSRKGEKEVATSVKSRKGEKEVATSVKSRKGDKEVSTSNKSGKEEKEVSTSNKSGKEGKNIVSSAIAGKSEKEVKKVVSSVTSVKSGNGDMNDLKLILTKSPSDSKAGFKSKYPSYLSKKLKNSVWKKKNKSPKKSLKKSPKKSPKKSKHSKSKKHVNGFLPECAMNGESKENLSCPTSSYLKADQDLDVRKTLDRILDDYFIEEKATENHNEPDAKRRKISVTDDEETDFTENSLDSDSGALVINVIEEADISDRSSSKDSSELLRSSKNSAVFSSSNAQARHDSSTTEDSLLGDSFDATNQTENSEVFQDSKNKGDDNDTICKKYIISVGHPAHDLLIALKKYFLNGECLICGFIPADKDFNASQHMESHVLCNSFASSYKCSCCDDKFSDPRNLYMHALSREKTYNYICSICTLKFKRRHYLLRHTTKSH